MQLAYTPRSHFARKVRILLDAMGVEVDLIDMGNVAEAEAFGGNPLMKGPTLIDGDAWIIESDHIAGFLVDRFEPADPYAVHTRDPAVLNARAVMNGIMAAEVEILLARRTGAPTDTPRFDKLAESMARSMGWLDTQAALFEGPPTYLGFHLVCLWDHLVDSGVVALDHPALQRASARLSEHAFVSRSAL